MPAFTLSALVAYANHRVIGYQNTLPWHLPADLKRFKALTTGKPIIMGKHTHLSIGKALPERVNIVLSRDPHFEAEGCVIKQNLADAIHYAAEQSSEAFIIGGAHVYQQALPLIQLLYVTEIQAEFKGDAHFPELNSNEWQELSREIHSSDERNPHHYTYITLKRIL